MGKGGGSPGPSQNTTVTSNIPEYAKPYVTNMFEATQQQLFTGNKTPEGGYDITGFRPYQPYSTNVNDYSAGFSPLQRQAQFEAGAMQQPGQFALGSGLTGAGGIRSLGAAGQFGQNVTNRQRVDAAGNPMFDANRNPMFDASNTTQSYMSPYMQNVTDVAKAAAVREAEMAKQAQNLGAARTGTYGGARNLLANTERERNLLSNLSNIQTQGAQSAYDRAMQTQQFGANLGMQGYGQAMGAGAQLGQLGATQQGADIARQNQMAAMGGQQQALEQQKINQAIQDYGTQQQYPLMQLGVMSNMLRGLPMEATNRATYQAPPSAASQLGGLGLSALGIYGMSGGFKGAKGGPVKMAQGGLAYRSGGDIKTMPTEQLEKLISNPNLDELEVDMIRRELMLRSRMAMNPESDQIMAPALRSGIASISTGEMVPENMAGGGIVAFREGGNPSGVDAIKSASQSRQSYRDQLEREVLEAMKRLKTEDPFKESRAQDEQIRAQIAESKRMAPYAALTAAGLRTMQGTSQDPLSNFGAGGEEGFKSYARSKLEEKDLGKILLQQGVEREKSKFARETGLLGAQQTALGQLYGKEAALEQARATAGATATNRAALDLSRAQTTYNTLLGNARAQITAGASKVGTALHKKYKGNPDQIEIDAQKIALENLSPDLRDLLKLKPINIPNQQDSGTPPAPGKAPASPTSAPPKAAIQQLKNMDTPETRKQFDAIFGVGAAQRALGK